MHLWRLMYAKYLHFIIHVKHEPYMQISSSSFYVCYTLHKKIIPFLCWLLLYVAIVIWFQSLSPYNDAVVVTDDDDDVRCMQFYAKRKKIAFLLQSKGIHNCNIKHNDNDKKNQEKGREIERDTKTR